MNRFWRGGELILPPKTHLIDLEVEEICLPEIFISLPNIYDAAPLKTGQLPNQLRGGALMDEQYAIYGLIDPRSNVVFYIGKTSRDPIDRFKEHIDDRTGMSPKQERIREMFESTSQLPELVVLEDTIITEKSAFIKEVFWIDLFTTRGTTLTNASIDYNGVYFLSEHHLNEPSGVSNDKESAKTRVSNKPWSIDIRSSDRTP